MANSDEIIDLILAKYSKRKTRQHLKFEAEKMKDLLLADVVEPGYFTKGRWESILATYKKAKLVRDDLTIDGMLYTDYTEGQPLPWGIITGGGSIILVSWMIFFVIYRSRKKYILELALNQKLTSELSVLNTEKDRFFSIIAHDLRNPFMGLLNLTTILEEDIEHLSQDEIRKMAGNLRGISEKTYILLNELLDWARFKRGFDAGDRRWLDLGVGLHLRDAIRRNAEAIADALSVARSAVNASAYTDEALERSSVWMSDALALAWIGLTLEQEDSDVCA